MEGEILSFLLTMPYEILNENGIRICQSATLEDAKILCSFDFRRTYRQIKIAKRIPDQIVNISSTEMESDKQLKGQLILNEGIQQPFNV
jgi:hypothetical protein